MLRTNTTRQSSSGLDASLLPAASVQLLTSEVAVRQGQRSEAAIDEILAASFPASDPPAWNPGLARPGAAGSPARAAAARPTALRDETVPGAEAIDMFRTHGSGHTVLQGLLSLTGAAGLALLVPAAILLVALPIALAVRGLLEVLIWVLAGIR